MIYSDYFRISVCLLSAPATVHINSLTPDDICLIGHDPKGKQRQNGVHTAATDPVHDNTGSSDVIIDHTVE